MQRVITSIISGRPEIIDMGSPHGCLSPGSHAPTFSVREKSIICLPSIRNPQ